ncbi:MAG: hypothetical protein JWR26_4765 [Pedosphaera sp.]|nr:hypothetical protein [Pedosphaera sp.]
MKQFLLFLSLLGLSVGACALHAEGLGDSVVVIYNTRVPESKTVADHYASIRHVPDNQVFGFDMPDNEVISRGEFRDRLQKPLLKALQSKNLFHFASQVIPAAPGRAQKVEIKLADAKIRYAVLCYGVPLRIAEDPNWKEEIPEGTRPELQRNGAAVDNELACLPMMLQSMPLAGPRNNDTYSCTNTLQLSPTNGILMVARLDGPTAAIARGLVDKAIQAETDGLWGRAYFDLRGLTSGEYKIGDDVIRGASEVCRRAGFETIVDTNGATFPASFPLSQVAFYAGWYEEHVSGPFARSTVEFMPGAFAYHLHSFSAATLRSLNRQWVGPLLARGATATMGCVDEPYLAGTPDIAVFFSRFCFLGFSFGEAAYASQRFLSWQTTVVGDPLYHPFAKSPQDQHADLENRHNKLIEWSYLKVVNFKMANGTTLAETVASLENLKETAQSAVLKEKLADLYSHQGKPSSSVHALQETLKLDPTPQQRIRLMLTLADRLVPLDRDAEAYEVYRQFLKEFPDYPDQLSIYKRLLDLAHKLGKKDDTAEFEHEISRLAPSGQTQKGPPLRKGI